MTILQLKYVLAVASSPSMREAASKLYISQPALSATIRELEEELNIVIFNRTNKGISLTEAGNEFLSYAKQAVGQYELIEDRYIDKDKDTKHFSVSMQHYVFAVRSFVNTIRSNEANKYVYSVRETFAYVWKGHPLASKSELSLDELREYPCVSFDQSSESEFYLTEEALGNYEFEN